MWDQWHTKDLLREELTTAQERSYLNLNGQSLLIMVEIIERGKNSKAKMIQK
jgi:hypothetical protein